MSSIWIVSWIHHRFTMDGVGKISDIGWEGMCMFSIDHKMEVFRLWVGKWVLCIHIVLCFGWSPAPFIYSTLMEKVACAIRKWTIAPLLTWIDDNWGANSVSSRNDSKWDQLTSAKRVCFIALMVLFHAGYFVNIDKSVLDPTSLIRHLGITFGVFPEQKVFSATRQKW